MKHSKSHRKQHGKAMANPEVRQQVKNLKSNWKQLNAVQRGDQVILLLKTGCTIRGLASELGVDEGTIRRARSIARMPGSARGWVAGGFSQKRLLRSMRGRDLNQLAEVRLEQEALTGISSDRLADKLAWFVLSELTEFTRCYHLEKLLNEAEIVLAQQPYQPNIGGIPNLPRPVSPAYPLARTIDLTRPAPLPPFAPLGARKPGSDWSEMERSIQWLVRLILTLEPKKRIRNAAFAKLQNMLRQLPRKRQDERDEYETEGLIRYYLKTITPIDLGRMLRSGQGEQLLVQPLE